MSAIRILRGVCDALLGLAGLVLSLMYGLEAWAPALSALLLVWGLYEVGAEWSARAAGGEVAAIQAEQARLRADLDASDDA